MSGTSDRPVAELHPHPAGWTELDAPTTDPAVNTDGDGGDDFDPDPTPSAVLPAHPVGKLDLWAVQGPNLDAEPDAIDRATCLRYYGDHEYDQAVRDAEKAAPIDPEYRGRAEVRVCDERGRVWHRAKCRAVAA